MVEIFHGRRLRYQISLLIEGRWRLISVIKDEREQLNHAFTRADLDKLEDHVRSRAHAALATPGARVVRVIRARIHADGDVFEEVFLHQEAKPATAVERSVSAYAGAVPVCATYDDLLERPALRVIGLIMRPLLDRLGATPIELVTLTAAHSTLKREEAALAAAITAAARLQADAPDVTLRARIVALENLMDSCRVQVRQANLATAPTQLGPIGLDRFVAAVAARYPPAEQRFWSLRGIAEFIAPRGSYPMKLDRLIELNKPLLGPEATELFDEVTACLVDHSDVVRTLLGDQADLRSALLRLAELAGGIVPTHSEAPEAAAQLALLIGEGGLMKTRDALLDRVVRSLAGQRALVNGPLRAEQVAIGHLHTDLLPRMPPPWRAMAEAALRRRQAKALQAILDEMER
jgi:hypothetical protein